MNFQRRSWFRLEGSEVSSFEDAVGNVKERYGDDIKSQAFQAFFTKEERNSITQLYEKLCKYTADDSSILNAIDEDALLSDPEWISIVNLSTQIYDELNQKINEVNDA